MSKSDYDNFLRQLDENHEWPCTYIFKFIVPKDQVVMLEHETGLEHSKLTPSKKGKYVSVTFEMNATCADDVVAIYKKASKIKGIMSL